MTDTDRAPLDGLNRAGDVERRHRFFRFDPTVSSGTLIQLGTIMVAAAVAYGTYREDRTQTRNDIDQVKAMAARDREDVKAAFETFRGDMKDLKTDMRGVSQDVAVLRAQGKPKP